MAKKKGVFNLKDPAVIISIVAFAIACAALLRVSFAARPVRTSGSCSVNPAIVSAGQDYTITGSNLGAYTLTNVQINDSQGTQSFSVRADADGVATVPSRSYYAGTDTVKFNSAGTKKISVLASCSFQVQ